MELLIGASVAIIAAIFGLAAGWRLGIHPVQQALVNALKDRVALLEAENASLKIQVAEVKAENLLMHAENLRLSDRIARLERVITDRVVGGTS